MKKTALQQILSQLKPVPDPDPGLEQYQTPPRIAADALNLAHLHTGFDNADVMDLGTGNGILAIAAALLGGNVNGFDTDPAAVTVARGNAARLQNEYSLTVDFTVADITDITRDADIVVMNPPFGIQNRDANKTFLEKAFQLAPVVYSFLHISETKQERTETFYENLAAEHGYTVQKLQQYQFPLPRTQDFHDKEKKHVPVGFYRFTTR